MLINNQAWVRAGRNSVPRQSIMWKWDFICNICTEVWITNPSSKTVKCGQQRGKVRYSILCDSAGTTRCCVPRENWTGGIKRKNFFFFYKANGGRRNSHGVSEKGNPGTHFKSEPGWRDLLLCNRWSQRTLKTRRKSKMWRYPSSQL